MHLFSSTTKTTKCCTISWVISLINHVIVHRLISESCLHFSTSKTIHDNQAVQPFYLWQTLSKTKVLWINRTGKANIPKQEKNVFSDQHLQLYFHCDYFHFTVYNIYNLYKWLSLILHAHMIYRGSLCH